MDPAHPHPPTTDLSAAFGAVDAVAVQCFSLYVPNKDRNDGEFGTQRRWVLEAVRLLSAINGGATAIPVEGGWVNRDGVLVLEHPVVVYSFVTDAGRYVGELPRLREFLHRLGRETDQGEIAFEFDDKFYRVRQFDPAP